MAKIDDEAVPARPAIVIVASGRDVAKRWYQQYHDERGWMKHGANGHAEEIYDALCALGENPDPRAVAEIIGNKSWSFITCQGCNEQVERAVRLGDGHSVGAPILCRACCFEGALALMRPRTDKIKTLDETIPGWRNEKHANGARQYADDGTMLDDRGNRSIFDDVNE